MAGSMVRAAEVRLTSPTLQMPPAMVIAAGETACEAWDQYRAAPRCYYPHSRRCWTGWGRWRCCTGNPKYRRSSPGMTSQACPLWSRLTRRLASRRSSSRTGLMARMVHNTRWDAVLWWRMTRRAIGDPTIWQSKDTSEDPLEKPCSVIVFCYIDVMLQSYSCTHRVILHSAIDSNNKVQQYNASHHTAAILLVTEAGAYCHYKDTTHLQSIYHTRSLYSFNLI